MSIYATLWSLKFPRTGQYYLSCEWIEVHGQAVPGHVGTPTAGFGYEDGDPFADFLPPAVELEGDDDHRLPDGTLQTTFHDGSTEMQPRSKRSSAG